jgi:hypothetical protein
MCSRVRWASSTLRRRSSCWIKAPLQVKHTNAGSPLTSVTAGATEVVEAVEELDAAESVSFWIGKALVERRVPLHSWPLFVQNS